MALGWMGEGAVEITNFWMGPTLLTFLGIKTVASFSFDDLIISPLYFILFYLFFYTLSVCLELDAYNNNRSPDEKINNLLAAAFGNSFVYSWVCFFELIFDLVNLTPLCPSVLLSGNK